MEKTTTIQLRVAEDLKKEMIETAKYYRLTLSNYLTLLHTTTQDKDSSSYSNRAINNFKNNN
ncbi:hypothetical protein [Methylotenera sp. 1P/1]|uniref:hypothetical protein n=1 Tax=Methylotenera sp. 1P/1 TaxID=1131551 RepID=UPI000379AD51|nr:hypothetical protein [Methylotenera sp. 1P/1]